MKLFLRGPKGHMNMQGSHKPWFPESRGQAGSIEPRYNRLESLHGAKYDKYQLSMSEMFNLG